ncbi:MAG: hypothetical protein QOI51_2223 [Nocardioidaceae bacterium]|jgi:hypothetical protein|nr:hypothetical protein [Nocardioidaceae bacterium]MDX6309200.1 hypothetical protein [Nocardioidaceae bacterium]
MAKRPKPPKRQSRSADGVGPRQPCPCGSGRRYKACHGAEGGGTRFVARPFQGLPGECDWVALREFVQAGTAPLTLKPGAFDGAAAGTRVVLASLLPAIAPVVKRDNGDVWVAAQVTHQSGDPSNDMAVALGLGLAADPGETVTMPRVVDTGSRLQDVVDPGSSLSVTVLDGFDFWFEGVEDTEGSLAATLEQLNDTVEPTKRLTSVDAAYWASSGTKEHLRWVLPQDEEKLLTALARLHDSGHDRLLGESRLVGSFRAHGLLVPVWELPVGTGADALEEPAEAFSRRLDDALADSRPLTATEKSARSGLANRQLTVR